MVLGLAGAALAAVAGSRTWAEGHASAAGMHVDATVAGSQVAPLVSALSLVALAAWGVVLVTRRRLRRGIAVIGLLAGLGALVASVLGRLHVHDMVTADLLHQGAGHGSLTASTTGWWVVALIGALVTAAAFVVALRRAPGWPEMGSKYDAPAFRADAAGREPESAQGTDMWRALDEGRDPTS